MPPKKARKTINGLENNALTKDLLDAIYDLYGCLQHPEYPFSLLNALSKYMRKEKSACKAGFTLPAVPTQGSRHEESLVIKPIAGGADGSPPETILTLRERLIALLDLPTLTRRNTPMQQIILRRIIEELRRWNRFEAHPNERRRWYIFDEPNFSMVSAFLYPNGIGNIASQVMVALTTFAAILLEDCELSLEDMPAWRGHDVQYRVHGWMLQHILKTYKCPPTLRKQITEGFLAPEKRLDPNTHTCLAAAVVRFLDFSRYPARNDSLDPQAMLALEVRMQLERLSDKPKIPKQAQRLEDIKLLNQLLQLNQYTDSNNLVADITSYYQNNNSAKATNTFYKLLQKVLVWDSFRENDEPMPSQLQHNIAVLQLDIRVLHADAKLGQQQLLPPDAWDLVSNFLQLYKLEQYGWRTGDIYTSLQLFIKQIKAIEEDQTRAGTATQNYSTLLKNLTDHVTNDNDFKRLSPPVSNALQCFLRACIEADSPISREMIASPILHFFNFQDLVHMIDKNSECFETEEASLLEYIISNIQKYQPSSMKSVFMRPLTIPSSKIAANFKLYTELDNILLKLFNIKPPEHSNNRLAQVNFDFATLYATNQGLFSREKRPQTILGESYSALESRAHHESNDLSLESEQAEVTQLHMIQDIYRQGLRK